jgi:ABC-type uncharacterized transport system substrate-binding protein
MTTRRAFIGLLGGAATWPLAARAQHGERMRRIGVLMAVAADTEGQARMAAFLQGLQQLGWTDGRNLQIDTRWGAGDADRFRKYAAELVALAPDVILAVGGAVIPSLLQATRTVPIVFTQTPDPVGAGFVDSLARPLNVLQRAPPTPDAGSSHAITLYLGDSRICRGWRCSQLRGQRGRQLSPRRSLCG